VIQKTVLIVDDEQGLVEALGDALHSEGYRVLKAYTAEDALRILREEQVHLATVDVMLTPGKSLEGQTTSHTAGILLCETITRDYPNIDVFCLSVVSDTNIIREIESFGVRFLRKGETPLRTVMNMIRSRLTGIAYSTDRPRNRDKR
jgi:DNA-binding response OmpR family regulator